MHTDWQAIEAAISKAVGHTFAASNREPVGGGCINSACRLSDGRRTFFVKLNSAARLNMFEAEAQGLREIADTNTVRVPLPLCHGLAESQAYLVLEHLPLGGGNTRAQTTLGRLLAQMHRIEQPYFGWHRDNTIGSTPQINTRCDDWVGFYRSERLRRQYELAARNGYGRSLQSDGERLLEVLDNFFGTYSPHPSLLHGDLWSGNFAVTTDGEPVVFDPASYYGDREADLAMSELFGGFNREFYAAYADEWPLDSAYSVRRTLYNLYHVLNHLNLFGGGYLGQAQSMTGRLLSEIR